MAESRRQFEDSDCLLLIEDFRDSAVARVRVLSAFCFLPSAYRFD